MQEPALQAAAGGGAQNLIVNIIGLLVFKGLFFYDFTSSGKRVEQRKQIRQAQIRQGDREVFVNEQGETMSRLKEVRGSIQVLSSQGLSSARLGAAQLGSAQLSSDQAWLAWSCQTMPVCFQRQRLVMH